QCLPWDEPPVDVTLHADAPIRDFERHDPRPKEEDRSNQGPEPEQEHAEDAAEPEARRGPPRDRKHLMIHDATPLRHRGDVRSILDSSARRRKDGAHGPGLQWSRIVNTS